MPIMRMKALSIVLSNLVRDWAKRRDKASCGVSERDSSGALHRLS